jgi:endonuclease YncB( thermonuclease family)
MKSFLYFALLTICVTLSTGAYAESFTGKVVGVHDGDTVTVLMDNRTQVKIRLAEIDAPELAQPYGNKSKQALSDLVFGQKVTVVKGVIDKYGRTVGRVYQSDIDVNLTMVKQGAAWAYRQYLTDDAILAAEESAKATGAGLWSLQDDQRMPPWEWRHGGKRAQGGEVQADPAVPMKEGAAFACAKKMYCKQMTDCAEARFYLTQCGVSRLDGDHDGTPCESICR